MEPKLFDMPVLRTIGKELQAKQQTIAVSESVTSGLLQFAFSNMENAEKFYHGGITAYNIGQKFKHLNVEPIHAIAVNCVSQKIADQMALNVAALFNSHWGIGITGYASATPESGNEVFAYYSISFRQSVKLAGILNAKNEAPPAVQLYYATELLGKLKDVIIQLSE
jgi:nicotinamide-nucleotide amidase